MAPVNRSWTGAAIDRLFAWTSKLPAESCSYTVERLRIPVDDTVEIATDLYQPVSTKPLGTLLVRSPYGIGMPNSLGLARIFAARGYQVLFSSCRGAPDSDGAGAEPGRHEAADGQAVVAWMRKQVWYTGSFATLGGSYMGYVQWALLSENPPSDMKAAVIKTGPHDFGGFMFGTGAIDSHIIAWTDLNVRMGRGDGFISLMWHLRHQKARLQPVFDAVPLLDAVAKYLGGDTPKWLRDAISHPDSNDERWKALHQDGALERANIPILLMSGWYDVLLPQVMEQYTRLAERGCNVALTVGPWTHLGAQRNNIQEPFDWLDEHFTHTKKDVRPSPVRVFITGTEEWRDLAKWPPPTSPHELFLSPDRSLSEKTPPAEAPDSSFKFDPADPTPSMGGPSLFDAAVKKEPNTPLASRSDVLTFTTAPLDQDLEVSGKPLITLCHSTDIRNVDLLVLLSEVDSTGVSHSISERYLRLDTNRHQGEPMRLDLRDCAHRFGKGSRIRMLIAGGSHPRYIRNLGTGENPGTGSSMRPAVHTVRHNAAALSRLVLPVTKV